MQAKFQSIASEEHDASTAKQGHKPRQALKQEGDVLVPWGKFLGDVLLR